jgi:hypothetical protein
VRHSICIPRAPASHFGLVGGEKLAEGTHKRQKFGRKIAEDNNKRYSRTKSLAVLEAQKY